MMNIFRTKKSVSVLFCSAFKYRNCSFPSLSLFTAVLWIRIRIRIRIPMFLGLPDPDPLVRGMDPDPDPAPDPDPSIIMQK